MNDKPLRKLEDHEIEVMATRIQKKVTIPPGRYWTWPTLARLFAKELITELNNAFHNSEATSNDN